MFGGSFNPIHFGHLLVADEVCETLRLDRLLLVPAAQPPHKPLTELAPAADRYQMTALAVREHPRFEVSDVEVARSGPSYTVDTLTALQDRGRLHLIIGSETFLDLLNWRDPQRVVTLARLVVIPRNGMDFDPDAPAAVKVLRELGLPGFAPAPGESSDGAAPLLLHAASLPISGSDLRRRAREGRSLAFRMPDAVAGYLREHHLYRPEA
ncbi:MAG TPA: nicotinate-nucleotide adenylyltransferase [Candidatus Dormibacteraeota bacterium]|nr:nicotinate-nucleotide adenylyltransferase [Candidatus Dormibacteraeota bacterium]